MPNGGWTPAARALYFEFAADHVAGTPWPIKEVTSAARTLGLDCSLFTQHILMCEAKWRRKEQAKEEAKKELISTCEASKDQRKQEDTERDGRAFNSKAEAGRQSEAGKEYITRDKQAWTPDMKALYGEFAKDYVAGTLLADRGNERRG